MRDGGRMNCIPIESNHGFAFEICKICSCPIEHGLCKEEE